jgi:hypothetical protein
MNGRYLSVLGLAIALGSWGCAAQEGTIPFGQLEHGAQLSAMQNSHGSPEASEDSASILSRSTSLKPTARGVVRAPQARSLRAFTPGYLVFNGAQVGMGILDVELTQHCIADNHCREGNPMMPSSQAGQVGVVLGLSAYSYFVSYKLKKQGSRFWWLAPAMGVTAHAAGAATGLAHW